MRVVVMSMGAGLLAAAGCVGQIGDVEDVSDGELRGAASCVVEPDPVEVDAVYVVTASRLVRLGTVEIVIEDGAGVRRELVDTDAERSLRYETRSTVAGPATVSIRETGRRSDKELARCELSVVGPCTPAGCAVDACGVIDDGCGGTTDCGPCDPAPGPDPFCGDGICDATEHCTGCATDCGSCAEPTVGADHHVFLDTDGDGVLNDCAGHDSDGDGLSGPDDELDAAACTGASSPDGRRFCRAGDSFDLDGDGQLERLHGAIHDAAALAVEPGDVVNVHEGTYGDTDGDGHVDQLSRYYSWSIEKDAVVVIDECPGCADEADRRFIQSARHGGVADDVVIDLGNTVATAFGSLRPNYVTIQGFHIIHQDMDTLYPDISYSGTIGRRNAFEFDCESVGYDTPTHLVIQDNVIDQQLEVMPEGDLTKKWSRGHIHFQGCGYAAIRRNRMEGAVYTNVRTYRGPGHVIVEDNVLAADNDTPIIYNNMAYGVYFNGNDGNVVRRNYIYRTGTNPNDASAALRIRGTIGPDPTIVENNVLRGYMFCVYHQSNENIGPGFEHFRNNTCVSDGTGTVGKVALHFDRTSVELHNNVVWGFRRVLRGTLDAATIGHNLFGGYQDLDGGLDTSNITWAGGDVCHGTQACGETTSAWTDCQTPAAGQACDPDPRFTGGAVPSPHFELQSTSPAIDAGSDAACAAEDYRGAARSGPCDIGAFER